MLKTQSKHKQTEKEKSKTQHNLCLHHKKKREEKKKGIPQNEAQRTQPQNASARGKSQKKVGEDEA